MIQIPKLKIWWWLESQKLGSGLSTIKNSREKFTIHLFACHLANNSWNCDSFCAESPFLVDVLCISSNCVISDSHSKSPDLVTIIFDVWGAEFEEGKNVNILCRREHNFDARFIDSLQCWFQLSRVIMAQTWWFVRKNLSSAGLQPRREKSAYPCNGHRKEIGCRQDMDRLQELLSR